MGFNGKLMGFNGKLMGFNGILMGFNGKLMGFNGKLMGFNGILMGFNGKLMGFNGKLMGFNGKLMGFNGKLMGFNGILMGFNGKLMGFNGILMGFNGKLMGYSDNLEYIVFGAKLLSIFCNRPINMARTILALYEHLGWDKFCAVSVGHAHWCFQATRDLRYKLCAKKPVQQLLEPKTVHDGYKLLVLSFIFIFIHLS